MGANLNVAVVGAGITGAACAAALSSSGVPVTLFERGRAPGGRMASPTLHGRRVDLGAAYFTVRDPLFAGVVQRWRAAGLARPWTDTFEVLGADRKRTTGPTRWSTPGGLRSLVRDLLDSAALTLDASVTQVGPGPSVDGRAFDAVVLAMPDPQAARLAPSLPIGGVDWQPVIALAAGWAQRSWDLADAAFVDHPDITFIADDGSRRGDGAAVLVVHSSPALAGRCYDEPQSAEGPMLSALSDVLDVRDPRWTHAHRWGLAKPAGTHGEAPFYLGDDLVGVANDSWSPVGAPRVESAWLSGHQLGAELAGRLTA